MANSGSFKKGEKRPNQGKRGPNKTTKDVREAIALIAQRNVDNFGNWITAVAAEDPAKAADLFLKAIEYHIPKLARQEIANPEGEAFKMQHEAPEWVSRLMSARSEA